MLQLKRQLKHYLDLRRITASELARRSGVPKQTISNWLADLPPHGLQHVKRIADALSISLDELCYEDSWRAFADSDSPGSDWARSCPRAGMFRVCSFDGHLVYASPPLIELLGGWTEPELHSSPWLAFVHPEDRLRLLRQCAGMQKDTNAIQSDIEYRVLRKDHEFRWVRRRSLISHRDQLVFSTCEDISEQLPFEADEPAIHALGALMDEVQRIWDFSHRHQGSRALEIRWDCPATRALPLRYRRALLTNSLLGLLHIAASGLLPPESAHPLQLLPMKDPQHPSQWLLELRCESEASRLPRCEEVAVPLHGIRSHGGDATVSPGGAFRVVLKMPKEAFPMTGVSLRSTSFELHRPQA